MARLARGRDERRAERRELGVEGLQEEVRGLPLAAETAPGEEHAAVLGGEREPARVSRGTGVEALHRRERSGGERAELRCPVAARAVHPGHEHPSGPIHVDRRLDARASGDGELVPARRALGVERAQHDRRGMPGQVGARPDDLEAAR